MKALSIGTTALFSVAGLVGCSEPQQESAQDVVESARGTVEAATEDIRQASQAFLDEAREATDDLGQKFDDLEARYATATDEAAGEWESTRAELAEARQDLEADLTRMRAATGAEAEALRGEIADDIQGLTERVAHARLAAAENGEEFVAASRAQLTEIDEDIRNLQAETALMSEGARAGVSDAISELRFEADHLEETVSSIAGAGEEEVSEVRDDVAQAIASLTASVRREWLEIRNTTTQ
jgi:hypothetical protein